jgi:hypothetical protein
MDGNSRKCFAQSDPPVELPKRKENKLKSFATFHQRKNLKDGYSSVHSLFCHFYLWKTQLLGYVLSQVDDIPFGR